MRDRGPLDPDRGRQRAVCRLHGRRLCARPRHARSGCGGWRDRVDLHSARTIADLQPAGPITIGGNCQGAELARATAKQLRALGREIALLIALDADFDDPLPVPTAFIFGQTSHANPLISSDAPPSVPGCVGCLPSSFGDSPKGRRWNRVRLHPDPPTMPYDMPAAIPCGRSGLNLWLKSRNFFAIGV